MGSWSLQASPFGTGLHPAFFRGVFDCSSCPPLELDLEIEGRLLPCVNYWRALAAANILCSYVGLEGLGGVHSRSVSLLAWLGFSRPTAPQ